MPHKKQLFLFCAAIVLMTAATGINDSVFNNFLSDTYKMTATARGWLELPRELPGFLVVVTAGLLAAVPMTLVGGVAAVAYMAGMAGLALFGGRYGAMVAAMMLASTGLHLLQPVTMSVTLALSSDSGRGKRIGQIGMFENTGIIVGAMLVWLLSDKAAPQYRSWFTVSALFACAAAGIYSLMHMPHLHEKRPRLLFRKRYSLYYGLELLFGARKQIFITFGPWVLITVYGLPATSIAKLLMTGAAIGLVFKPLAGLAIDRFGERAILIADGLVLTLVCIGYGYALPIMGGDAQLARTLASACFVADNLLFALGAGRAIYISRIALSREELSSTLGMGVSINHIVSMTIPAAAGALWAGLGFERVFLAAAILALTNAAVASFVPGKEKLQPQTVASES
ncbi:MAG TPA: MFS transporter [Candidatus Bathyarchaeia archaeon]|nr:MFS transporter [Candidatus Bathyarchaeia archaeon]